MGAKENIPLPPSPDVLPDIQRFTPEDRERLQKVGFLVYSLTGWQPFKSEVDAEKDAQRSHLSNQPKDDSLIKGVSSRLSEVAIIPAKLFLPRSNKKTLHEQEKMIRDYSLELQKTLKTEGIKAIMGELPDYVELAFTHTTIPEKRLFGRRHGFYWTRTQTPKEKGSSDVAVVGCFDDDGLRIFFWGANNKAASLWVAPLVVPA